MSVYVRWWWFYNHISEKDINYQLCWIKEHNFDGFEIAWMYSNKIENGNEQIWLSNELKNIIKFTKD